MNIHHNRSTNNALKRHVPTFNEIIFLTKSFEHQCVIIHTFLNQGDLAAHCLFIGHNYSDFNSRCLSNAESLFYETLPPKNHSQVSFDKKGYQDAVLVLFTATPPAINTANHTGGGMSYP